MFESLSFEQIEEYMQLILYNRQQRKCSDFILSHINFFGGEPLICNKEIIKVIEKYGRGPFVFSIITNGLLLNKEILQRLKDYNIVWQISLDSVNPYGNIPRFGNKTKEYTQHLVDMITLINKYEFSTPIISSVINSYSIESMVETHLYFVKNRIPIQWQFLLDRKAEQEVLLDKLHYECETILKILLEDNFNIPMLWNNIITYIINQQNGLPFWFPTALTDAPSPNNLYIVGQTGKLYLTTNYLHAYDSAPKYENIGDAKTGIKIEKVLNHPTLLKHANIKNCQDCPCFYVNPCCIQQNYFVYPTIFTGNCNIYSANTYFALEYLQRGGKI
jgi:sulfatase maturation enzyme AslB (radical SAM superfamily)